MGVQIKISPNGRVMLPADVRRRLGYKPGDYLLLQADEFGVTLMTTAQRVAKAQALYREFSAGKPTTSVDEFIAEKRQEVAAGLA